MGAAFREIWAVAGRTSGKHRPAAWGVALACGVAAALWGTRALAEGPALTRADVAAILGTSAAVEDFEKFHTQPWTSYSFAHVLNSEYSEWGPGLVNPGLTFRQVPEGLAWNGLYANYAHSPNLLFMTFLKSEFGTVDFAVPTPAFGVDLSGSNSVNTPPHEAFELRIYGADDVTLLSSQTVALNADIPFFFGYSSPSGIGSFSIVKLEQSMQSVQIDNLLYQAIPEPAALPVLLLVAMIARRGRRPVDGTSFNARN